MTTNHFQGSTGVIATATETATTILTGVDDGSNRSTHVPEGRIVKYCAVTVTCQTIPAAVTRFNMALFFQPGAKVLSTPITDWFTTTDPVTGAMVDARTLIRSRMVDVTKPSSDYTAFKAKVVCKRPIRFRDGDDLRLWILQDSGGNLNFNYTVKALYR